jgi:hypothetical protein
MEEKESELLEVQTIQPESSIFEAVFGDLEEEEEDDNDSEEEQDDDTDDNTDDDDRMDEKDGRSHKVDDHTMSQDVRMYRSEDPMYGEMKSGRKKFHGDEFPQSEAAKGAERVGLSPSDVGYYLKKLAKKKGDDEKEVERIWQETSRVGSQRGVKKEKEKSRKKDKECDEVEKEHQRKKHPHRHKHKHHERTHHKHKHRKHDDANLDDGHGKKKKRTTSHHKDDKKSKREKREEKKKME